jgi:hypothetical protein
LYKDKPQSNLENWEFSQEKSRELLAKMIILHECPFRMVEHHLFREFVTSLQPEFQIVGRHTIRDDCIKIYNEMKLKMIEEISVIQRVALTTDLWTSTDQTGYMVVTAHYIDNKWDLKKRIIGFKPLPSPHTSQAISDRISQSMLEWNLTDKCAFITLDNASANDASIKRIQRLVNERRLGGLDANGAYFHLRCAAHVINLVVKDGLKSVSLGISKLRSSVKWIRQSPTRKEAFNNAVKSCGIISDKKPTTDVATRWNSTFLMIDSSLPFKIAFENLSLTEATYDSCPTQEEWLELNRMRDFLAVFRKGEV